MLSGKTQLIAHIGYPTETFKAPMIYNPWFDAQGIDARVVPMGVKAEDFVTALPLIMRMSNVRGALITMPHKVTALGLLAEVSPTAQIAGACNAVRAREDGALVGDMFDGAGFVRGVERKGRSLRGARVLVNGAGGVGSAIAASIAAAGAVELMLHDARPESAVALGERLHQHYPRLKVRTGSNDPAGWDVIVNATPLGMKPGDPLPFDVARIAAGTFVGEVVMKTEHTPLLQAALAKGCPVQVGTDMLFEQIPAYLEFFGYGTTTADVLRGTARLSY
ncbi:shikimate dehydrogenase family protein [Ottowia sp.]|uniref:shikimate dehydrogenase family protein n=1 Tax=Ottowia sp. TaxID=1898956 RepID=UPI002C363A41|nr:shikimate dehydrogenase [Ottowia sp.]